jgi:hypothetical protein
MEERDDKCVAALDNHALIFQTREMRLYGRPHSVPLRNSWSSASGTFGESRVGIFILAGRGGRRVRDRSKPTARIVSSKQ